MRRSTAYMITAIYLMFLWGIHLFNNLEGMVLNPVANQIHILISSLLVVGSLLVARLVSVEAEKELKKTIVK